MVNEMKTVVVGNLTENPKLRTTEKGTSVTNFTIANTPRHYDSDEGKYVDSDTSFVRVTAWEDLAEHIVESLSKGTPVIATGHIVQETSGDDEYTNLVLKLDEIGPSLRFGTAVYERAEKAKPKPKAKAKGKPAAKGKAEKPASGTKAKKAKKPESDDGF